MRQITFTEIQQFGVGIIMENYILFLKFCILSECVELKCKWTSWTITAELHELSSFCQTAYSRKLKYLKKKQKKKQATTATTTKRNIEIMYIVYN